MEHLDDNAAAEFASGALSPSALRKVEGHLASCRDCRALVAALAVRPGDDSSMVTFRRERSSSAAPELPATKLTIGDRVGRYLVLSSIGSGGMGVVFAAYDPQLDRKIALKLLRAGLSVSSKDARTRLRREAQAIAQLSHPNVISIYDVGTTDDGDLYIAMEFVEGDTLTTWLKKYPRSWREIIDVFVQAARGLLSAHRVGLLHRDFKPDNVLVGGDGRVRVTDFGLARSLLAPDEVSHAKPVMNALDLALTATGTVLGTPRYMPPEQLTGQDLDARSDQFSFCVALYEALYGTHPLRDGTSMLMLEHGDEALPPPEGLKVPASIGRAVLRGLERDRSKRFGSMGSLIDELVPAPRRSPVRYAGLAIGAVLLAGGATAAVMAQRTAPPPLESQSLQQMSDELGGLRQELQRVTVERDKLRDKLEQARVAHAEELARLSAAVEEKNEEIDQLTSQLAASNDKFAQLARRSARLAQQVAMQRAVVDALGAARGPVTGCFQEWAERSSPLLAASATLLVGLTVTPDGIGTTPRILTTPDARLTSADDRAARGMLEHCASEQIARVKYPASAERLELAVTVQWAQGQVKLDATVVARQAGPNGQIEL